MPRRKKPTEGQESRGQDGEKEEEEKKNPANAKKKRSFVDAFIVISDSDGEQESKEESGLQKKRTKQQLDQTKFAAKRKIAQMTEEEQFALALKMSEQEARQVNCQEEEEEELLRKAIAESLSSCQPSDSSDATPQLSAEALGAQGQSQPTEKEGSEILGGLALCPNTPHSECSSHSQSSRADGNGHIQHNCVSGEGPACDKVKVSSGSSRLTPRRLFTSPSSSSEATGSEPKEQLLPCTGHSVGEAGAGSSAMLRKSRTTEQCESPRRSSGGADLCMLTVAEEKHRQEDMRDTVHYYWGIPFCPKGVDPNQYTKVILCQLEVYQKSLKQAQRQLLHKKEFGNPVVPSSSLSQNELGKGDEISRENGVTEGTEDGDTEGQESESITWLHPSKRREAESPGHSMEEEKNSTSDDEPTTSYCQVSQALPAEDAHEDGEPMQIAQSISTMTPLGSKRTPDIARENSAEEEISVCPETQPSPLEAVEERKELCSDNRDAPMQVGGDEDAGGTVSKPSPTVAACVSCPMCNHGFPTAEIELHAMYCNGIVGTEAGKDTPVLTRRQRETRNKAASGEGSPSSLDIDKCEKCYLCKSLVPLLQYQRHVDSCLQAARQVQG
ncbi:UIMC1 protein, partial [Campylorhamphus procurvoides]|nr:UIMC1 protein [Campylorhamphus procurvoides]